MMVIEQYDSLELACEKTRELNGVIIRGNGSMSPGNRSFWIKKVRLNKKIKFLVIKNEELEDGDE